MNNDRKFKLKRKLWVLPICIFLIGFLLFWDAERFFDLISYFWIIICIIALIQLIMFVWKGEFL